MQALLLNIILQINHLFNWLYVKYLNQLNINLKIVQLKINYLYCIGSLICRPLRFWVTTSSQPSSSTTTISGTSFLNFAGFLDGIGAFFAFGIAIRAFLGLIATSFVYFHSAFGEVRFVLYSSLANWAIACLASFSSFNYLFFKALVALLIFLSSFAYNSRASIASLVL